MVVISLKIPCIRLRRIENMSPAQRSSQALKLSDTPMEGPTVPKPEKDALIHCAPCSRVFRSQSGYSRHIRSHKPTPSPCEHCKRKFPNAVELENHIKLAHDGAEKPSEFKCELCSKSCSTAIALQRHIQTHTKEKYLGCKYCDKKFPSLWKLTRHAVSLHLNVKSGPAFKFECCGLGFKTTAELETHQESHKPSESQIVFECQVCVKSFTRKYHLQRHIKVHLGEKAFDCETCKKSFSSRYILNRHKQSCLKDPKAPEPISPSPAEAKTPNGTTRSKKPFGKVPKITNGRKMTKCKNGPPMANGSSSPNMLNGSKTPKKPNLSKGPKTSIARKSLKTSDDPTGSTTPACPLDVKSPDGPTSPNPLNGSPCRKALNGLRKPKNPKIPGPKTPKNQGPKTLKFSTGQKDFACEKCPRQFARIENLKRHLDKHIWAFKCECCEMAFTTQAELVSHTRTHTGEKPFSCPIERCLQRFSRKKSLTAHIKNHEKLRVKTCLICDLVLNSEVECQIHERTHRGEDNRFVCSLCPASFARKKALKQHLVFHKKIRNVFNPLQLLGL